MPWKVKFFLTASGDSPVEDFIAELDVTARAKISLSIRLLANQGPFLKPPYIKKLQNKLYELRISTEVQIRIFYTICNNEYYLLHAFVKKTQKTPLKELKTGVNRMKEISLV